jgi:hypothetical protein
VRAKLLVISRMNPARDAVVRRLASVIALYGFSVMADPLSAASAMAQEAADSIDLNGVWRFDYEVVDLSHEGTAVRAEFLDGAECFDGRVRPYFLNGVLSGASLTGTMMVCSRSPDLVEACGISSMYETTFEATVEPGRIAGTRVAQGLATEEEDGRIVSCTPDSRYDGEYDFLGSRSCTEAEREVAERQAAIDELKQEADSIVSNARDVIDDVHLTAREHFGEYYDGRGIYAPYNVHASTDLLLDPLRGLTALPDSTAEPYFKALFLLTVEGTEYRWLSAGSLAGAMARYGEQAPSGEDTSGEVRNGDPLPQAGRIVGEMNRIESLRDRSDAALDALDEARRALRACRENEPPPPPTG